MKKPREGYELLTADEAARLLGRELDCVMDEGFALLAGGQRDISPPKAVLSNPKTWRNDHLASWARKHAGKLASPRRQKQKTDVAQAAH